MSQERRASTLIELLTVIAIIAIIAAILFPVFARARAKAQQSSCLANLKQLATASLMYAADHDNRLCLYSQGDGQNGYFGADGIRWADMLFPYVKNSQLFDCPAGDATMQLKSGGLFFDITAYTYGYNTPRDGFSLMGVATRPLNRLTHPANTIMFAEGGRYYSDGDGESYGRLVIDETDTLDLLAAKVDGTRHTNAADSDSASACLNVAFCDGHVKYMRLSDTFPVMWRPRQ